MLIRTWPKSMSAQTHHSGQLPFELFGNHGETPAGLVQKLPAFPHGRSVISCSLEFLGLGDISLIVPYFVIDQRSGFALRVRVSAEH